MISKMYINKIFLKEGLNMEIFHEEAMRRTRMPKRVTASDSLAKGQIGAPIRIQ